MNIIAEKQGVVLGFGGTNARYGESQDGDISNFQSRPTPQQPGAFFSWLARQTLDAADAGNGWLVAGFPGPVSEDGKLVGPLVNVSGLSEDRYNLAESLTNADPAMGRLLDDGFLLLAVNDGELAAQAAATRIGDNKFNKTASLILGTGVGAGIVVKDRSFSNVYRADKENPTEIGHIPLSTDPADTFENFVSGPALERDYGIDARYMAADHPAWKRVGETAGRLAMILGIMNGVELVVACGGVGSGASENYSPHLRTLIETYKEQGNSTQKLFLPEIVPVPSSDAQLFEMYGGEGVVRDFSSRDEVASS